MSEIDSELFELCKSVYEATGWDEKKFFYMKSLPHSMPIYLTQLPSQEDRDIECPLYNSDYLLEKLPSTIQSKEYPGKTAFLWTRKDDDLLDAYPEGRITYFAWYFVNGFVDVESDYGVSSDTPVKALLKLTIALHEAGVKL